MTRRVVKRYSEAFKRMVVAEYEAGSSMPDLRKKYGIGGVNTIREWVEKYSMQGLRHKLVRIQSAEEANRVRALEAQVQELEQALGRMTLEKLALESELEVLQETYGVDAKKNAASSSSAPGRKLKKGAGAE